MKDVKGASEDDANLLVLIIDTNPFMWTKSTESPSGLSLDNALCQLLVFINAHMALKHDNKLAVIASHVGISYDSKFLYPATNAVQVNNNSDSEQSKDTNMYQTFRAVNNQVTAGVRALMQDAPTLETYPDKGSSMIASALSMALCYVNRVLRTDNVGHIKPRILIVSVSSDSPYQYIGIMNCIFSAQKASIPIDVCKVYGEDTVFLQQAAHITEGVYLKLASPQGFLQYLMEVSMSTGARTC
ncbi:5586_t:CDS:2 [Paraglomus brasilianum]|uniref:General transcription and DNA repair factor IIH subunit TFB4 n=1 Tax=Paraglomus brasilianum TaxID=144538 RepID=A0A9N9A623_9GLOM|nr:5586_t:CDS:2 [Paraglomus brasilianum]